MNNQEIKQDLTIIPGAKQICTKKTGLNNRFKQMEEKVIVYRHIHFLEDELKTLLIRMTRMTNVQQKSLRTLAAVIFTK